MIRGSDRRKPESKCKTTEEECQRKHSTEVIDLEGKMVLPGFVEKMG